MYGAIPNPKKTVTVNFPIEQVKIAARNIDKVMQFCHFIEKNDMFASYKFSRSEFLSMGAFINIHLDSISENKTQVDIEISRKLGAFDEWVEVTKANRHLEETINAMSSIIQNGVPKAEPIVEAENLEPMSKSKAIATLVLAFGALIGLAWFLIKMLSFSR
jgi:hypothetical protein